MCPCIGIDATTSQRDAREPRQATTLGAEHEHERLVGDRRGRTPTRRRRRRGRRTTRRARAPRSSAPGCPTRTRSGGARPRRRRPSATAGRDADRTVARAAPRRSRPAVSAVRITAPRFCGSVTPSSATRNAVGIGEQLVEVGGPIGAANATTPCGDVGAGLAVELIGRDAPHPHVGVFGELGDLVEDRRAPASPTARRRGPAACPPRAAPAPRGAPRPAGRGHAARRTLSALPGCDGLRAPSRRGRSSVPGGAARTVLELDAARRELVADLVAAREVARLRAPRRARGPARRSRRRRRSPTPIGRSRARRRARRTVATSDAAASTLAVVDGPVRRVARLEDRRERLRRVEVVVHRAHGTASTVAASSGAPSTSMPPAAARADERVEPADAARRGLELRRRRARSTGGSASAAAASRNARAPYVSRASASVREVADRLRHLLAADGDHARVHPVAGERVPGRLRPAPARSRGAGTRGRRRRRGGRNPRRGGRATSPSTRCASPGAPCPTASPTRARRASPPSRARSPSGCASPRRPRRARPPTRAAPRGCGAAARRSRGTTRRRSTRPRPSTAYAWPRSTSSLISSSMPSMYSVACGHVVGARARRGGPSASKYDGLVLAARAPARVVPALGGAGDDLVVDVGDVADVGDVEPGPLEVAADHVEHHGGAPVTDVRRRRRPWGRTRTSTPCPGSRVVSSTVSRSNVSRIRTAMASEGSSDPIATPASSTHLARVGTCRDRAAAYRVSAPTIAVNRTNGRLVDSSCTSNHRGVV